MKMTLLVLFSILLAFPIGSRSVIDYRSFRQYAAKYNVSCMLVFGDSSVDSGNNNFLSTPVKGNYPPYGKDFFGGQPTGRFSDGRLATDFIAEAVLGHTKAIPPFLDPSMKIVNTLHGVSFASAASGYDDLTANLSNVLPLSKQLEYFMHYKMHLRKVVGMKKSEEIIKNAIFVISMGTNDFLQNYYVEPIRSKQYTIDQYQDFLVSRMSNAIEEMKRGGATRLVVVGVPPMGCMPLVKTIMGETTCVENYNKVALSFNSKIQKRLNPLTGIKHYFIDAYGIMLNAVNHPQTYGFIETTKGCCGSGTVEYGDSCKGMSTCEDPSKYAFWDAVHPTQKMYHIFADEALENLSNRLFE